MSATKIPKHKTSRKPTLLKEVRAVYITNKNGRTKTKAKEVQLEFHICLPKDSDVERFANKLIQLVEKHGGEVGAALLKKPSD